MTDKAGSVKRASTPCPPATESSTTTRLSAKASQRRLVRVVGTPIYAAVTIRSWDTTRKLAGLSAP